MAVHVERAGDVVVVVPESGIPLPSMRDEWTHAFELELRDIRDEGATKILLDLHEVQYLLSHVLGILIHTHQAASEKGGALYLCNVNDRIMTTLEVTKLSTIMKTFADRDAALKAFDEL